MREFRYGDEVEFEIASDVVLGASPNPRWFYHLDYGATGLWWPGVVAYVGDMDLSIFFLDVTNSQRVWQWPKGSFSDRPGWLRHRAAVILKCECGGTKLQMPHSHWCPAKV
jgi:hypothetical protein